MVVAVTGGRVSDVGFKPMRTFVRNWIRALPFRRLPAIRWPKMRPT